MRASIRAAMYSAIMHKLAVGAFARFGAKQALRRTTAPRVTSSKKATMLSKQLTESAKESQSEMEN